MKERETVTITLGSKARKFLDKMKTKSGLAKSQFIEKAVLEKAEKDYPEIIVEIKVEEAFN